MLDTTAKPLEKFLKRTSIWKGDHPLLALLAVVRTPRAGMVVSRRALSRPCTSATPTPFSISNPGRKVTPFCVYLIQMDESTLIDKLRRIETLYAGATTPGEKDAAERARQRILERLAQSKRIDPPVEYHFSMGDMWSRKVFVALLRRYDITPYRYKRQRHTTVMARVPHTFVDETLWPEFQEFSNTLKRYLSEVTERVVSEVLHEDSSDAEVVPRPRQISFGEQD